MLIFVIILAALAFSGKGLMQPAEETKVYNYSDLISELDQDNVKPLKLLRAKKYLTMALLQLCWMTVPK